MSDSDTFPLLDGAPEGIRTPNLLLVVPPHTVPDRAHSAMMAAATPDDDSTVDGLLMISLRDSKSRNQEAAAQQRWESEGGAER